MREHPPSTKRLWPHFPGHNRNNASASFCLGPFRAMQNCLLLFTGETAAQHSKQAPAGHGYPAKRSVLANMRSTHHALQHTHTSVKYSAHTLQLRAYTHSWTHAYKHAHKPLANLALTLSDAHWPIPTMHIHIPTCVAYTCTHTHTYAHTHIHTYTHTHAHTYTLPHT